MKIFVTIAMVMVLATYSFAANPVTTVNASLGGINTVLTKAGYEDETIGQAFLGATVRVPMDTQGTNFIGLSSVYDTESETEGFAIRYYRDLLSSNPLVPGIGIGGFRLDQDNIGILDQNTIVLGGDFVLDAEIPFGGKILPVSAALGFYTSVTGDDVQLLRFGVSLSPELFTSAP